ncbi:MAG: cofactor-independent phosphoglycerate mutase [Methanocellales archaeon]|nr:cofactor-independent phosphoglycerate mutase [Methanocellales archaeon]
MKYVVLVGDGMADYPLEELGNKTPLQVAHTPNMDFIASNGKNGIVRTVPSGMIPGSDVASLSILGYDPRKYYPGRGPLEAASMGVSLHKGEVAFRCNLVTVKDGVLVDYSAGHISSEEARILIEYLDEKLDGGAHFYPGVSYRHLLVLKGYEDVTCVLPHEVVGYSVEEHLPKGRGAEILRRLMRESIHFLDGHKVNVERRRRGKNPANMIWPWGQGRSPNMPPFEEKFGLRGSVIAAVDVIKGIGRCIGLRVIEVPGATGYLDTNYEGKADYALRSLADRNFCFVHVEAPDEAGHSGDVRAKIKAIENFDEKVVGRVLKGLKKYEEYRIMVLPDHPTPIPVRTHTSDEVPFAIYSPNETADDVKAFDELSARRGSLGAIEGKELMRLFIKGEVV